MLEINLLPVREERRRADLRQQLTQIALVLLITFGGIAVVHARVSDQISDSNERVEQMKKEIDAFKPELEQVAAFKRNKGELQQKIDVIENLDKARNGPVRMLAELAVRTPDRLWLRSLRTDGDRVTISGESLDNELVALFLRGLNESPYFEHVDLDGTEMGKEKDGLKFVTFDIRATLVNRGPGGA